MINTTFATTLKAVFITALCALQPNSLAQGVAPIAADFLVQLEHSALPIRAESIEVAQGGSSGQESKSFVYQNIRITVTRRGVVAGDLRTGKVVWRDGFWQNPTTYIILAEVRFFGEYLYYRSFSEMGGYSAGLQYSLNGKVVVSATGFYLKESLLYYFDNVTVAYIMERYFADIVIREFNSVSKLQREIVFTPDKYIKPMCRTDSVGGGMTPEFFKFISKNGNIWLFGHTNKKCDMQVSFDSSDVSKFSVIEKRKNK